MAAKEAEVSGQSEVVANVSVAPPNGDGGIGAHGGGGIGAHGGVHLSARGIAGVWSEVGAVAPQIGWAVGVLSAAAAAEAEAAAAAADDPTPVARHNWRVS